MRWKVNFRFPLSLFWKIFGWFWLSLIMVIGATILYVFGRGYISPFPPGPPPLWSVLSQQISILFATGLLVSYALARYLASPAIKLRRATHQLASGDLSVRIGPQMGRRRDELADMGRDFDMMAERIETLVASERRLVESQRRTVEAQQRLIADISHELRSPLARIAYALNLAKDVANEESSGYLNRIELESGRLNELIGQLLTLARLDMVQPQEGMLDATVPFDLTKLVRDICQDADFEATAREKRVRFDGYQKSMIKGSTDLLRSAIENVVRNAVRHTPTGSTVLVTLETKAKDIYIVVRDQGPGVPQESLTELFHPFYRVEQARDRESGGVGLGLSITERATRFHGGRVQATNANGGGLEVELVLPLLPSSEE